MRSENTFLCFSPSNVDTIRGVFKREEMSMNTYNIRETIKELTPEKARDVIAELSERAEAFVESPDIEDEVFGEFDILCEYISALIVDERAEEASDLVRRLLDAAVRQEETQEPEGGTVEVIVDVGGMIFDVISDLHVLAADILCASEGRDAAIAYIRGRVADEAEKNVPRWACMMKCLWWHLFCANKYDELCDSIEAHPQFLTIDGSPTMTARNLCTALLGAGRLERACDFTAEMMELCRPKLEGVYSGNALDIWKLGISALYAAGRDDEAMRVARELWSKIHPVDKCEPRPYGLYRVIAAMRDGTAPRDHAAHEPRMWMRF